MHHDRWSTKRVQQLFDRPEHFRFFGHEMAPKRIDKVVAAASITGCYTILRLPDKRPASVHANLD